MNKKIQCLIDGGFISIADVVEYAEQYKKMSDELEYRAMQEYVPSKEELEYYESCYLDSLPQDTSDQGYIQEP